MKTAILVAALMTLGCAGFSFAADVAPKTTGTVYHVVSVKFKEDTTPEQIKIVEGAFRDLKTKIPGILTLHWGTNVSPEKRDHGFTHCFVLTFASDKDRDAYLVDPAHKEFGKLAGPHFADVMVIDFVSQD
jgi:hypothetical protein